MRFAGFLLIAALAACSTAAGGANGELAPLPFPVERGSALPPPNEAASGQAAPAQGVGPGGIDFGQWRAADPASYAPTFQTQIRARYAGQSADAVRADLERNGFACSDAGRLDCRIEIMENQCAVDWYVVIERGRSEPIAGFDRMCLGAR